MIIDTGKIKQQEKIDFEFHMWINESVEDETRIAGKSRSFKISIETAESNEDIILAATLDGKALAEFPKLEDNYGVESINCTDNLSASFNPVTWSVTVDGIVKSDTSCVVNFSSSITLDQTDEAILMDKSDLYAFYKGTFASTATSGEILEGKTVYLNGIETVGTMENNGGVQVALTKSGEVYTIPEGYHDGGGKVTGATLAGLVGGNVNLESDAVILTGYTAYGKNGTKYTGSMANNGAVSGNITTSGGTYTIPAGYHNGSGKVTGPTLASLVGSNVTLASAGNLLSGVTAYGKDGTKYTGTMANKGAVTGSITTSGGSYTIPAGYHNGSGKVTGPTLASLVGSNVTLASAANLLTGYTAYGKNGTKYTGSMVNNGAVTKSITPSKSTQTYTIPAGYHNGSGKVTVAATTPQIAISSISIPTVAYSSGADNPAQSKQLTVTSATSGSYYIAAMGGDPGDYNNFSVSGATIVNNLTVGDVPPSGNDFARMVLLKATSTTIVINWGDYVGGGIVVKIN